MFGTRRQGAGDHVAVFLRLINPIGEVLHPRMRVVIGARFTIVAVVPAHLQAVQQVGFGHHIVMLIGQPRIARVVGHQNTVDIRQRIGLRPARLTGGESPQLIARRRILLIAEPALLHILRLLLLIEVGAIERAALIHYVGKVPAQHDVINAVAMLRIALFDNLQPEQHAANIDSGEANLARFVQVVHLLTGNGVVGFVGYLVLKQHQLVQRGDKLQKAAIKLRLVNDPQLACCGQRGQIRAAVPHGGGGVFIHRVHQTGGGLVVSDKIGPGVARHLHLPRRQVTVAAFIVRSGQADGRLQRQYPQGQQQRQPRQASVS